MILNNAEKKCLVDNLTWLTTDMKLRYDELRGNIEVGSQGGYSSELMKAITLLDTIKKTKTVEITGCHRKIMGVNCREFGCKSNRQGICALSTITLEAVGGSTVGKLSCVQAGEEIKD